MIKGIKLVAVAALAASCLAAPADARGRWRHHHHDDVDAGDVIAGAAVIGGIAALASAIGRNNRERQDRAVGDCSNEAESRTGGRVGEIVNVRKSKGYYTVEGLVDQEQGGGTAFLCTVRNGRIYSFQARPAET
jgi:hypothetical protein